MKNNNIIRKICIAGIALIFATSVFIPNIGSMNISFNNTKSFENLSNSMIPFNILIGPLADVWDVELEFNEPGGAYDNAFFGEKTDASEFIDIYDVPKSPAGISPFIISWFDTSFSDPYDELWGEYKQVSDNYNYWNLLLQWTPSDYSSPTSITISWDVDSFKNSEYASVVLYDVINNVKVADMLVVPRYTFICPALTIQKFQIILKHLIIFQKRNIQREH